MIMYTILPDYISFDENIENLGPVDGLAQEKEYHPLWFPVGGLTQDDSMHFPRQTVASKCAVNMYLYLFWDKENTQNLNAVAAYLWDQRRDQIGPDSLLGYLPDNVAVNCINDYLTGEKRFLGLIRKLFTSASGQIEVYIELLAYSNPTQRKNRPQPTTVAADAPNGP